MFSVTHISVTTTRPKAGSEASSRGAPTVLQPIIYANSRRYDESDEIILKAEGRRNTFSPGTIVAHSIPDIRSNDGSTLPLDTLPNDVERDILDYIENFRATMHETLRAMSDPTDPNKVDSTKPVDVWKAYADAERSATEKTQVAFTELNRSLGTRGYRIEPCYGIHVSEDRYNSIAGDGDKEIPKTEQVYGGGETRFTESCPPIISLQDFKGHEEPQWLRLL